MTETREGSASALRSLRRPFESLPSRIISSVFAVALVTSLAVTWISTQSIESFLRLKIDEKFPSILRSASERLDLWYTQRQLDIGTFARSTTVVDSLAARAAVRSDGGELGAYVSYVLERFPQFESLFVLDAGGDVRFWAGPEFDVSEAARLRLARVGRPGVGGIDRIRGQSIQLASAPVLDARGRRLASLHGVIELDSLDDVLRTEDLGDSGGIQLVSANGEILLSTGAVARKHFPRSLPAEKARPLVADYTHADGRHVVGSSVHFPRFGWTIVVEELYDEAFAPVVENKRRILAINLGIVLFFGTGAFVMARSIVRPIRALSDAARRVGEGEGEIELPETDRADEIGVLTRTFIDMTNRLQANRLEIEQKGIQIEDANARLIAQNRELQRVNEVFQQLSITDDLTRLHNHRFFQEQLPREIKRSLRTGEPLALVLIDIDDFKGFNDRFGHAVGDAVLRRVAEVMNASVREVDLLARYGGEEFALLATHTDLEGAEVLAEKLRLAVEGARFSVTDTDTLVSITVSLGVALFEGDERAFFVAADRALYAAKAAGRNCVVVDRA